MSEATDAKGRAPAGWSAAGGFLLVAGVNLVVGLGLFALRSRGLLFVPVDICLGFYPVLSLGWNVTLCLWVQARGGSRARKGALTGTAVVFLASSGCWLYEGSNFKGG